MMETYYQVDIKIKLSTMTRYVSINCQPRTSENFSEYGNFFIVRK